MAADATQGSAVAQPIDEAALLKRISQYDTAALADVYDRYYQRIYRYIYTYLGRPDAAEDLAANVFLRLLSSVQSGNCPRSNLCAWLYRVAHNLVVDGFRRRPAEEVELQEWVESKDPDVLHMVEHNLQMERVRFAMHQLTDDQQQVIAMKFIQGMDSREVGYVLGKTEGAVDALQHRALLALRKALSASQGFPPASQPRVGSVYGGTSELADGTKTPGGLTLSVFSLLLHFLRNSWVCDSEGNGSLLCDPTRAAL